MIQFGTLFSFKHFGSALPEKFKWNISCSHLAPRKGKMRETDSKSVQSSLLGRLKGLICGCAAVMGPIGAGLYILLLLVSIFYLEENWHQNGTVTTSGNKAVDAKDWVWADQEKGSK